MGGFIVLIITKPIVTYEVWRPRSEEQQQPVEVIHPGRDPEAGIDGERKGDASASQVSNACLAGRFCLWSRVARIPDGSMGAAPPIPAVACSLAKNGKKITDKT